MAERSLVVVAMSGGVDSSVAAASMVEQGYQVIGLMLRLWAEPGPTANRCCTPDAVADARRVADQLGIPFYVRDYRDVFKKTVVDYFTQSYAHGLTPNPCIVCNEKVRFGQLLNEALALGASHLATGHYARLRQTAEGDYQILKGIDRSKDQSYVLYRLTQEQLPHILFPVGDYVKLDIRAMARERGLPVFERADSQDLCFVSDGDYRQFLARHLPDAVRPGPLLDTAGRVLGQHRGLPHYTVGQRKGLGIAAPQPHYVLRLDVAGNAVIVGTAEELGRRQLTASQVTAISGRLLPSPLDITAKIRYQATDSPAVLTCLPGQRAHLRFDRPLRDITPGQSVVFYQDDVLLGGGVIEPEDSDHAT